MTDSEGKMEQPQWPELAKPDHNCVEHYDTFCVKCLEASTKSLRSELERVRRELEETKKERDAERRNAEELYRRLIDGNRKWQEEWKRLTDPIVQQAMLKKMLEPPAPIVIESASLLKRAESAESDLARLREALEKIWRIATDSTKVTEGMDIADIQFVAHEAWKQDGATTSGEPR